MPTVSPSAFGPKPAFFDAAGNPDVSYKMFMYAAGSTSTKQNSYTNSTGAVANTNPIILNALGQTPNELWWDTSLLYKVVLAPSTDTDPPTNPVWTVDNLAPMNSNNGGQAVAEWILYSGAPTYVSANSFTVTGNQTQTFHIGRRLQLTTTGGMVYGRITNSVFASQTTVTLQMDGSQILDSSLSAVYYSILTNDVLAIPERIASTTGTNTYSATVGIARLVIGDEYKLNFAAPNDGSISPTLNLDGTGPRNLLLQNGNVPVAGQVAGEMKIRNTSTSFIVLNPNAIVVPPIFNMRQVITSAPVDANGNTALGGATGSATLTTTAISSTAPIVATAAAGVTSTGSLGDRTGISTANLTWTGLNTNGTMYLYVDISAANALTAVSGILAPTYQPGGTFSTANGQFTFNWSVMNQTVGNGTTAVQSYRVAVGEVTVAGGVVTAITWYAVAARALVTQVSLAINTAYSLPHNVGYDLLSETSWIECVTADNGFVAGDRLYLSGAARSADSPTAGPQVTTTYKLLTATIGTVFGAALSKTAPGNGVLLTIANWKFGAFIKRNW